MNRLNFSLPEFTRIAWISERAREVWQPRIDKINSVWPMIERQTVVNKLRPGALQSITPDKLVQLQHWCLQNKLESLVLSQEGAAPFYGNATRPFDPSKPWNYRVYIGKNPALFDRFWERQNDREIAHELGYPSCCAEFFHLNWKEGGWHDLTYAMNSFQSGIVDGPPTCNILLRHIGVRPVFHLPCKFDCPETGVLGKKILDTLDELGYHKELEWLYEMLNWPACWSSLHGVVMIITPCFKIVSSSDSLPEAVTIDRPGPEYPIEGATGKIFPFQQQAQIVKIWSKDNWTDNGFSNRGAMRAAHDLIIKATEHILLIPGRIIDLGCGNGLLLDRLHERYNFLLEPYGVEINPGRAAKARLRKIIVFEADVADFDSYAKSYELIIISINRLNEMGDLLAASLLKRFRLHCQFLLVYSYEKWPETEVNISEEFNLVHVERDKSSEVRIYKSKH